MIPKTILVVDDDLDYQNAVKIILENANFKCIQAYSLKEGLEKIANTHMDLIILDVMMEDISAGFRFARELRNSDSKHENVVLPVLMVSNIHSITGINLKDLIKKYSLPVKKFLEKPIEPDELIDNVIKLINNN